MTGVQQCVCGHGPDRHFNVAGCMDKVAGEWCSCMGYRGEPAPRVESGPVVTITMTEAEFAALVRDLRGAAGVLESHSRSQARLVREAARRLEERSDQ